MLRIFSRGRKGLVARPPSEVWATAAHKRSVSFFGWGKKSEDTEEKVETPKDTQTIDADDKMSEMPELPVQYADKATVRTRLGTAKFDSDEGKCTIRKIHGSPIKYRGLCRAIQGASVNEALAILEEGRHRRMIKYFKNAIERARRNGVQAFGLDPDRLIISSATAQKGQFAPRLDIKGRGRAGMRHLPFTHLSITVKEIPFKDGEKKLGSHGRTHRTIEFQKAWGRYEENRFPTGPVDNPPAHMKEDYDKAEKLVSHLEGLLESNPLFRTEPIDREKQMEEYQRSTAFMEETDQLLNEAKKEIREQQRKKQT